MVQVVVSSGEPQTVKQSGHTANGETSRTSSRQAMQGKHSTCESTAHSKDSKAACLFLGEIERSRSVRHSKY